MMDCQVTSISDQTKSVDDVTSVISEGHVGQVCKQWLIREDGNLAYRLQNEEITHHYNENRSKSQIARKDTPLAKHLQENEIIESQRKYELIIREQLEHDEKIARKIERNLWLEEEAAKKATEEADEKLAKKLMEKEKAKHMKKRLEKEKQQVERLSAQIGADYRLKSNENECNQITLERFSKPTYHRIMTEDEQELDLSEFCMPPPPGLTPEELKLFLEEQDAEIAQLLQRQELKRNRNSVKEKLALIEAQDFEIAKMLQKIEKERFKRIKDKLRNQQKIQSTGQDSNFRVVRVQENHEYQRTSTPLTTQESAFEYNKKENDYDIPESHVTIQEDAYEEPYKLLNKKSEIQLPLNFHNIAIDLDPTYKRRSKLQSSSHNNLIESCVDDEFQFSQSRFKDSLEKLHLSNKSDFVYNALSLTSSSGSSGASSGRNSNFKVLFSNSNPSDYAPPLPPRDVSLLMSQNKNDLYINKEANKNNNNLLPPHHPQHPNRRFCVNSNLETENQSILIRGQRRNDFLNKKSKQKNPDGCKTQ